MLFIPHTVSKSLEAVIDTSPTNNPHLYSLALVYFCLVIDFCFLLLEMQLITHVCMYMYVYICSSVCTCIYMYIHVSMCIHVSLFVSVCVYVCMCMCVYVYVSICLSLCMYVCMYVWATLGLPQYVILMKNFAM